MGLGVSEAASKVFSRSGTRRFLGVCSLGPQLLTPLRLSSQLTVYLGKRDFVDHIDLVDPVGEFPEAREKRTGEAGEEGQTRPLEGAVSNPLAY